MDIDTDTNDNATFTQHYHNVVRQAYSHRRAFKSKTMHTTSLRSTAEISTCVCDAEGSPCVLLVNQAPDPSVASSTVVELYAVCTYSHEKETRSV